MAMERCLGELAAELIGIEGTVETLSLLVQPKEDVGLGSTITQTTLEGAFYHVSKALERIADDLNALEGRELQARHEQAV